MAYSIIFDMDGVIFDSERVILEDWVDIARENNIPNIEETLLKCVGTNYEMTKSIFNNTYGERFPYDIYKEEQRRRYHQKYDGGRLPMKPGVVELLDALKEVDSKIAIASSTRSSLVKTQIEDAGLIDYFDVIIGGEMVEKSKPNPDIFLEAAKQIGSNPQSTFVIEDSYNGIRAAAAANMIPIMVPDLIPADDEMKKKAKYICKDLLEVKKLLIELF